MQAQELQDMFKKYSQFYGTADKREYWTVILISTAISVFGSLILISIGEVLGAIGMMMAVVAMFALGFVMAWIAFATGSRRARDAGINPWLVLTFLIPYLGWLAVIGFGVLDTKKAE